MRDLVDSLRINNPGVEIFTIPHGRAAIDLRTLLERGELPGWAREQVGSRFRLSRTVISQSCQVGAMAHSGAHLDLSAFSNSEELATLGLDR